jgi:hypothetical protein
VKRTLSTRLVAMTTVWAVFVSSCGSRATTPTTNAPPSEPAAPVVLASPVVAPLVYSTKDLPPGLDLQLSTGHRGAEPVDHSKLAPALRLADADAQAVLARGKPITTDPADHQAFALRPRSTPPPRTGDTIHAAFPPPASSLLPPVASDAGKPLEVLRYMPQGNVPVAPELSVTFSQPMIAVTSQADAARTTPVKLTPTPASGSWRWIGTRTIVFKPDIRFPQATTYKVEIPAGTKSASGNALGKTVRFTFETPAPTIVQRYPENGLAHLDEPMFAMFDQKIDPAAVLEHVRVTARGRAVAVELLDAAAIAKDKRIKPIVDAAIAAEQDGRWLAFRPTADMPTDTKVSIEFAAGTPSAEGDNKTRTAQGWSFSTYAPLKIVRAECGYRGDCRPGMQFVIQLNNPLDPDKFDASQIAVTPAIPNMKIEQSYSNIVVGGMTKAHTKYHVVVAPEIRDQFAQTLGKRAEFDYSVGAPDPTFFGPDGMVVVDPAAATPGLDVFTINYPQLAVKLYKVTPADYDKFIYYTRHQYDLDHPVAMPGTRVFDGIVKTTPGKDTLVETHIDLSAALTHDLGHVVAMIEPSPWHQEGNAPRLVTWAQVTKLGIDASVDGDHIVAFTTDLTSGKPVANVAVELLPFVTKASTDDRGLASLALSTAVPSGAHRLVARHGDDVAMLTQNAGFWNDSGTWFRRDRQSELAWYVVDDRQMYKPGEDVHLKGWLRIIDPNRGGDVAGLSGSVTNVSYSVHDATGKEISSGMAAVNEIGGFDTKFTLPKTPNLGSTEIRFVAAGRMSGSFGHTIHVEEFRRPEFEVSSHASQGPFIVGTSADITASAKYYAGGPLPDAPIRWNVTANQTVFTPPNRDDFIFGAWRPWWGYRDYSEDAVPARKPPTTWNLAAKTDASGDHVLHIDLKSVNPAMPMSLVTHASVTDVNRQTWTASTPVLVHPSAFYVGLKTRKSFVDKGQPFPVEVIGVDLDGKAVPGTPIEVKSVRLDYDYQKGKYVKKELDPHTCAVVAAKDPVSCQLPTTEGGTYEITATIVDKQGRPNQTTMTFWVAGGQVVRARDVRAEPVQLIPNKKDYAAGDTAEILVQSPFFPAEGVVSWRRSGIVKTERVSLTGPTTTIKVPIADQMVPNMYVQVDVVGMTLRNNDAGDPDASLPKRPAYASGSIDLSVPPKQRTLQVTVNPAAIKVAPGDRTSITVMVRDQAGRPMANAETAVIVVDESILSLTGYQFPNPVDTFYTARGADTTDYFSRAYIKLAQPRAAAGGGGRGRRVYIDAAGQSNPLETTSSAPRRMGAKPSSTKFEFDDINIEGDMDVAEPVKKSKRKVAEIGGEDGRATNQAVAIRSNFNPLAAFSPVVKSGDDGRATVEIKMPDNLTRYRVVAISVAGDRQFGKGESAMTARLPLMVRPSPPRFLNFGDTFRLPVVVQNQTDLPMSVKVAVRTTNARLTDGAGRALTVPPNDRVEVQFPAAAEMAGTARFQIIGTSGAYSDAAELALPVWTPATTEAFATYGVIDDGAIKQPVALPDRVVTQFGGLEVTTASTNLQSLTDAMLYLVRYPFECAEQRSSRILAIAALKDVLTAFKTADMPSPATMEASVATDVEKLAQMQNYDGGFAYWDRGHPSEPYLSVFVINALSHAKAKGFTVPPEMLTRGQNYLRNVESYYPWYYGKDVRQAISAFALYTRKQMGDLDIAKAQKLLHDAGGVDKVSMETDGWLLGTLAGQPAAAAERAAIVRHALNKVSETAGAANFTTSYGDGNYLLLSSDRRVDGVMLESLIQEQKDLDLIPKIVTGLLGHRKAGRWLNTQENSFIIQALDVYFQTYEKTTPDFVARAWLGNDYAGDKAFKGRSTDYYQIDIPMKDVATHDHSDLTIQKDGAGRLYYRIGMTYAPASLKLDAADYGFVVQRSYEPIDDPKDVTRASDGTWHVKAGAKVRVRLTMVNQNRRYHVALVDPLPAGLEPMNPALAVTGPIPLDPKVQKSRGDYWWWYGPWYEHQNLRDERVEAFASMLWEGVHEYEYVARATTPGNFVVPPTKAEEMYMPETFGRGASDRVIVE